MRHEMKRTYVWLAAIVAASASASFAALAHEGASGVVKERMDLMEAIGNDFKEIGQRLQANRNLPSIAERARRIEERSARIAALFPPGTLDRPTDARPVIWERWSEFEARARGLRDASAELAEAAPSGNPKLVSDRFKALTRSCNACHDDFRRKR